jgi:hypothetical protein
MVLHPVRWVRKTMGYDKNTLAGLLAQLDLGSSVAEQDTLLETARVETSVFSDLLSDRIDLVPGTKGSGKTALYRVFVEFLAGALLNSRKVVIAHGVQHQGDSVFNAYKDEFDALSEDDFVAFWCIYLISLAHEQFIKPPSFAKYLQDCIHEIRAFKQACHRARIPEIQATLSLKSVLGWALSVLKIWRPKLKYTPPVENAGEFQLDLFATTADVAQPTLPSSPVPEYARPVKERLDEVLRKANLSLWLMIDRLDEIFPRRSEVETKALRALLRTLRIFESPQIRLKIFLRDDILEQIVADGQGFTALTHVTNRQADTLRWSEDQILTMIVKRLFAEVQLRQFFKVDAAQLDASKRYQSECFYKVFPGTVHTGINQSPTLRWIYNHVADGRGVVTPRDIIEMLTKAKQRQQDEFRADPVGTAEWLIGPAAIRYGLQELSRRKRTTVLEAEFPHLWPHIKKFVGGKTEYNDVAIRQLLGKDSLTVIESLVSIGLLSKSTRTGKTSYRIPFVYRDGLDLTQGRAKPR